MYVVGICGNAGSGKDTVADYLVAHHKFIKVSFADPMKRFARHIFSFSEDQLWGPSSVRNELFPATDEFWNKADEKIQHLAPIFVESLPLDDGESQQFIFALTEWYHELKSRYSRQNGDSAQRKLSARIVLQTLGTECGRNFSKDLWVRYAYECIIPHLRNGGAKSYNRVNGLVDVGIGFILDIWGVVIPDHRFLNEVEYTFNRGYMLRVRRPATEKSSIDVGVAGHASEVEQHSIPAKLFDAVLSFDEGIEAVHEGLRKFCTTEPWMKKAAKK